MAQTTNLFAILLLVLAEFGLSACDAENSESLKADDSMTGATSTGATSSENTNTPGTSSTDITNNLDPKTAKLDGIWISHCATRYPEDQAGFEQEYLVVEGSLYERTISYYEDSNCSVPGDISFLRVRSTALQYTGGLVETERGSASQIVISPAIDFDTRLLTDDEAALFDPALYFYDFYLFGADGRLYFGSMNTLPADQFEQTLDSPHIFTAQ